MADHKAQSEVQTYPTAHFYQQALDCFNKGDYTSAQELASEAIGRDPSFVPAHQLLARIYLKLGQEEQARQVVTRREDLPGDESSFEWGLIAEEMGLLDDAMAVYLEYLRRFPHHHNTLYRLGLLYLDRGDRGKARSYLHSAVKVAPDFVPPLFELAQLYEDDGLLGLAKELYEKGLALQPENQQAQAALDLLEEKLSRARALPDVRIEPVAEAARALLRLFKGREDVYARQWIDSDGRVGYSPVYEPLTERAMENHIRGEITVGVYPLRADNTVHFMAVDVDINKNALARCSSNPHLEEHLIERVKADGKKIKAMFDFLGLPVYVESSGHKGCHLWLFFDEPMSAPIVRKFANSVLKRVGPPSPEIHWEVFPKQDSVREGQLGNLIKLPLGIHKKTGNRGLFIDPEGKVFADQVGYLCTIRPVSSDLFCGALERLTGDQDRERPTISLDELGQNYSHLTPVWERCKVIKALVEKAFATHHLTNSERVVLKCVFAHLGDQGKEFLHSVISLCLDYSREATQYQIEHTHRNPISCPRIRHHLSDLVSSVDCSCEFTLPEGGYPSPVLHLDADFTRGMSRFKAEKIDSLASHYVDLRQRFRQLKEELEKAEDEIQEFFTLMNTDTIMTSNWVLRKPPEDEEIRVELRG